MNHEKYFVVLAVAAFIFNQENKVLIIEKAPGDKIDAGLWSVPGGKVEPAESVLDALKREVDEEVGIKLNKPIKWLGEDVFTHNNNGIYYHGHHFLFRLDAPQPVTLEPGSFLRYKWMGASEIDEHKFHPNVRARLLELFRDSKR